MENNLLMCSFCNKTFKRESSLLKHNCELMKRYELFKTHTGIVAYLTFNEWRKLKNFPSVPVERFTKSRYFKAFIEFAEFSKTQCIPDKISYIKLMNEKSLLPFSWTDAEVYAYYLKEFDEGYPFIDKVSITLETLRELSKDKSCQLSEVFDNVCPIDILKGITSRRLYPVFLLLSSKFMNFMMYKTTKEERFLFNSFINVEQWTKYIKAHQDEIVEVRQYIKQLDL